MARQDITKALGRVIRQHRRMRKLSQEQLAFAAELARNYISLVELGRSSPTVDSLDKLSVALGVSASSLLAEAENLNQKIPIRRQRR